MQNAETGLSWNMLKTTQQTHSPSMFEFGLEGNVFLFKVIDISLELICSLMHFQPMPTVFILIQDELNEL